MLPGDPLYVRPLVLDEDLSGVPTVLLDLDSELAHPKTLPPHVQSDVTLLSSILQLSCAEEAVLNPKTQYFILMLMAMMRDTGEHLVTCGDVDIVLPRHPRAHLETLTDWLPKTCTAAAISMITFDSPGANHKTGTSIEEAAGDAMDVDLNDGEEPSASSGIDEVSGADIDAQQLHLLACPSVCTPFYISAVCMATHSTILDVMASALHQRRAWGLTETPVLGLAFDPPSTCLQTFWGWFENQGTGEDNCVVCFSTSMMDDCDYLTYRVACPPSGVQCCIRHCLR
ncbi:hypothetical protein PENSPDRAFT_394484 [Peniophora sp. CONT]|nr:hypothetical protein PENSPDRAFT_394484 [Peniophora sp. CONT]